MNDDTTAVAANTQTLNGDLAAAALSLKDREPVLVLAFVGWVLANGGDLAVNRFHWLTQGHWASISQSRSRSASPSSPPVWGSWSVTS